MMTSLYKCGDATGSVFDIKKLRCWFEPAVREAGIQNFTWHGLPHTFASRLLMAGVDLRSVQELMGHKSIQMTCRYAHLAQTHQLAAVERLAEFGEPQTHAENPERPRTEQSTDTMTSTEAFVRLEPQEELFTLLRQPQAAYAQ